MLKLLKSFEVSLPVYQMESRVNYQAIRQPSVFEGLLLNLAVKYKTMLGQYSLSQICEKFKIEAFLVQKALYSLIDNEMLERCDTEPYRVCRRPTFLRECSNDKTKIYP